MRKTGLALAVSILACGGYLIGTQSTTSSYKSVTASEFVVVDSQGITRMRLGLEKGAAAITLYDKGRKEPSVLICADNGLASLAILRKQGAAAVSITVEHEGCPVLRLNDAEGRTIIGAGLDTAGDPLIWVGDKQVDRMRLGIVSESPFIQIRDAKGALQWSAP